MSKKKKTPKRKSSKNKAHTTSSLLNKATDLHNRGRLMEAGRIYQDILNKEPNNPDALNLSGLIAFHDQNFDRAKKLTMKAIQNAPETPTFHVNMSITHTALQEYDQATRFIEQAINLNPTLAESWFQFGNLQRARQQNKEAVQSYTESLRLEPKQPKALNNLGNTLRDLGQYTEAIETLTKAIDLAPTIPELHNNLGNAYMDSNEAIKAVQSFQNAIKNRPDYSDAHNNIGYLLQRQGKLHKALKYLNKALEIAPQESAILHNLGNVYKDMGDFDRAIELYHKALAIKPDFTNVHTNILFAMNYATTPNPQRMFEEAKEWNRRQAAHLGPHFNFKSRITEPTKPLKIGYISPDFFEHSVSFFFRPLLKEQQSNFETFCYADVLRPDAMTKELQGYASQWRNTLGWTDEAVAQQIFDDGIDILIDLAGHTASNRLLVFARKPAPIQASWLGYPNTTGLTTIDYRISDHIADPEGTSDPYYTEKIIRLPHSFLCYTPPTEAPPVAPPPAERKGFITFGSFNNITKVTKEVVATWSAILRQVPGSKMLLKGIVFAEEESKQQFYKLFTDNNIPSERIILKPRTASIEDHLATYNKIDIGLDPFPYNGTTTTCEALWMGVPVVALSGDVHCARVSSSILHNCELTELIAGGTEEYISIAVTLANDPSRLSVMRREMRAKLSTSSLCNSKQFCHEMEELLLSMRNTWIASQNTPPNEATMTPQPAQDTGTETDSLKLNTKGEELFNSGDLQGAQSYFERAIQQNPQLSESHNNLGVLFFHNNDLIRAMTCFKHALGINPADESALENLSAVLDSMQANNPEKIAVSEIARCLSAKELQRQIDTFPFWYHKIDLPFGITTPGYAPISKEAYKIPEDLTGKRVLDVGAWDGHWTFEALKRGAKEVIAIDDFSDFLGSLEKEDRKAWENFDFCKAQLGYSDKQCQRVDMNVYDLKPETFGMFDVVFFFGTLYHLRHPLLALDNLAAVCTDEIYVESAILDDFSPYRGGLEHGYNNRDMVMEFYPTTEYGDNDSNWFCPTLQCLVHLVASAGFSDCEGWKLTDNPKELSHCRGYVKGKRNP